MFEIEPKFKLGQKVYILIGRTDIQSQIITGIIKYESGIFGYQLDYMYSFINKEDNLYTTKEELKKIALNNLEIEFESRSKIINKY